MDHRSAPLRVDWWFVFDQQLIARLNAIEAPGDPCQFADPSYIFRWGQTNAYHGQAVMQGPEDEGWGDRGRV